MKEITPGQKRKLEELGFPTQKITSFEEARKILSEESPSNLKLIGNEFNPQKTIEEWKEGGIKEGEKVKFIKHTKTVPEGAVGWVIKFRALPNPRVLVKFEIGGRTKSIYCHGKNLVPFSTRGNK